MINQYQGEYQGAAAQDANDGSGIDSKKMIIVIAGALVVIGIVLGLIFMGGDKASASECGDGSCDSGENCISCAKDCGCASGEECSKSLKKCVAKSDGSSSGTSANSLCGDGKCDSGENCFDCPDCKCGNGEYCSATEKKCVMTECGNSLCEPGESPESCCLDCACMNPSKECNTKTKKCETIEIEMDEDKAKELARDYYEGLGNKVESVGDVEPWTLDGEKIYIVEVRIEGQEWTSKAGVHEDGEVEDLPVL